MPTGGRKLSQGRLSRLLKTRDRKDRTDRPRRLPSGPTTNRRSQQQQPPPSPTPPPSTRHLPRLPTPNPTARRRRRRPRSRAARGLGTRARATRQRRRRPRGARGMRLGPALRVRYRAVHVGSAPRKPQQIVVPQVGTVLDEAHDRIPVAATPPRRRGAGVGRVHREQRRRDSGRESAERGSGRDWAGLEGEDGGGRAGCVEAGLVGEER